MSSETIIPGADGSEIVVRSLLPGLQRYPLQVRRQDRDHPKLPREGIHLHEAELPAVIRALGGVPSLTDQERIPILLTREQWLITQMILKAAGDSWRRQVGGPGAQTNYDDIAEDIAAQLRAQDDQT